MNRLAKISLGVFIPLCISAGWFLYSDGVKATVTSRSPSRMLANKMNGHAVDTAISLLREGDVVLRLGEGAESYMLAQMNRKNKSFSHCGVVMMEHGYPFVYHSIGGEDNPDERLRRDSANFFFSPDHNLGIAVIRYDMGEDKVSRLKGIVHDYYVSRPRFDMDFDLSTDDKLYCAEFIYKAFRKATGNNDYIRTTYFMGYTFVGIDDLFVNPHASMVWQTGFK